MNVDEFISAEVSRRKFLGQSAAGVVAGITGPVSAQTSESKRQPEPISLGIIGVRRRGLQLAKEFSVIPGATVSTICDLDSDVLHSAGRALSESFPADTAAVSDYRRLLDDDKLDAVVIATPDHWHAPIARDAIAVGKDIYLEAPVTHDVEESADLIRRASSSDAIVQCGLQQRSGDHFQSAIEQLRSGEIGRIAYARAWAVHRRTVGQSRESRTRPPHIDYQQWLGEARLREFTPLRFHYHWRWFWDYGSGELGDWGVHLLDIARWGLDVGLPRRVTATGMQLDSATGVETPDTMVAQFEYDNCSIVWEHRLWSDHGIEGRTAGVAFYGDEGILVVDRSGWKIYGQPNGPSAQASPLLRPHLENFLTAIRTRTEPNAPLTTGCTSSALCHLANAAYRSGRDIPVNPNCV